ncbi:hypothetical protein HID58_049928, partial [Brassica napus]
MKLSTNIILTILFISMARQLRQTDGDDPDHHTSAGYTDDFGPTSPGSSPGIGHKMKENNEFVEGFKDNSKPRTPGHSPGVGHAVKNNEPK